MKKMLIATAALLTGGTAIAQTGSDPTMAREQAAPETTDVAGTEYPPCDPGPGDDNCIQLYEPGVKTALAQWRAEGGARMAMSGSQVSAQAAVGGPFEAAWDTNQNKMFEMSEFSHFGHNAFTTWNTDADARLSQTEFGAGWTGSGWMESDTAFAAFDDDGDGYLDAAEFFADDEYGEWDADDNDMLDADEWAF